MARKREKVAEDSIKGQSLSGDNLSLDSEGKRKALEAMEAELNKRFGDGSVVKLGDAAHMEVEVIPTGSLTVDIALGVGGVPRGRIVEIYGPESSGKTTLCLHVVAEAQKRGGVCAFVDMEHALDPAYSRTLGVDVNTLYISQPDTAEQALEITEAFVRSGAVDVVVLDSVAALVPRVEIEGEMGESHVGVQARLMSQALRKLSGAIKQSNCVVLFTNQIREKIGVMYGCMRYDTPVLLADGTQKLIGEIVQNKLDVEVLSYNAALNTFEPRRIANWYDNGPASDFMRFTIEAPDGVRQFTCTPNHMILTKDGYAAAEDIEVGERLLFAAEVALAGYADRSAYLPAALPVTAIEHVEAEAGEHRFDIEVEGNHCYVVNGAVVHNSPETQPGGRALKFYATARMEVRKLESIKVGSGEIIGNRTRVRVTKNKVAPPFREAEFDIMFLEGGISKVGEILDLGTDLNIIEKRGAFFRYNDGLLGQGRENAKQYLHENPVIAGEIENAIRVHYGLPVVTSNAPLRYEPQPDGDGSLLGD